MAGSDGVAGRDVEDRAVGEEVARSQQQRHGLHGHEGEVLGGWDVSDTKGVPQDNVGVGDVGGTVADPLEHALGGFTRGLGNVATRGPELIITV